MEKLIEHQPIELLLESLNRLPTEGREILVGEKKEKLPEAGVLLMEIEPIHGTSSQDLALLTEVVKQTGHQDQLETILRQAKLHWASSSDLTVKQLFGMVDTARVSIPLQNKGDGLLVSPDNVIAVLPFKSAEYFLQTQSLTLHLATILNLLDSTSEVTNRSDLSKRMMAIYNGRDYSNSLRGLALILSKNDDFIQELLFAISSRPPRTTPEVIQIKNWLMSGSSTLARTVHEIALRGKNSDNNQDVLMVFKSQPKEHQRVSNHAKAQAIRRFNYLYTLATRAIGQTEHTPPIPFEHMPIYDKHRVSDSYIVSGQTVTNLDDYLPYAHVIGITFKHSKYLPFQELPKEFTSIAGVSEIPVVLK